VRRAQPLLSRPRFLTFDCYGTLVDWDAGILSALRSACPAAETVSPDALLGEFHEIQNALKTDEYRLYRRLLAEVTLELARRRGWDVTAVRAAAVPAAIPGWSPFPDTNAALARLHEAGIRLGILSNIDDDLLAGTLAHFEVPFERLVTAERLGSYKPDAAHFEAGRRWVEGAAAGDGAGPVGGADTPAGGADTPAGGADTPAGSRSPVWIHVAQSLFHDIEPATGLGLSTVWVNRKDEPRSPGAWPLHIARDLTGAVDWILRPDG